MNKHPDGRRWRRRNDKNSYMCASEHHWISVRAVHVKVHKFEGEWHFYCLIFLSFNKYIWSIARLHEQWTGDAHTHRSPPQWACCCMHFIWFPHVRGNRKQNRIIYLSYAGLFFMISISWSSRFSRFRWHLKLIIVLLSRGAQFTTDID